MAGVSVKGEKDGINIGARNNQKFVQIPKTKLKKPINKLCQLYGIGLVETEKFYTSVASFIDYDFLPNYGEKPGS